MIDIANQLADGLAGNAPEHVENGELNRGQRCPDGNAVVTEIEIVDEDLFQEQVEVARIFADEERVQVMRKNRVKRVQTAMPDRKAFRAIARTDPAQMRRSEEHTSE